jgi:hypothetical protein
MLALPYVLGFWSALAGEQSDFQLLLTRYVLERLLYRLSVSKYRDRFILKGALLLSIWVVIAIGPPAILTCSGMPIVALKHSPMSFAQSVLNQ